MYQSEGRHLVCILFFFCSTYFLRFISDSVVVPKSEEPAEGGTFGATLCDLDEVTTFCFGAGFIIYFTWVNVLFDFAPLMLIIFFHHQSFKHEKVYQTESSLLEQCERELRNGPRHSRANSGTYDPHITVQSLLML